MVQRVGCKRTSEEGKFCVYIIIQSILDILDVWKHAGACDEEKLLCAGKGIYKNVL